MCQQNKKSPFSRHHRRSILWGSGTQKWQPKEKKFPSLETCSQIIRHHCNYHGNHASLTSASHGILERRGRNGSGYTSDLGFTSIHEEGSCCPLCHLQVLCTLQACQYQTYGTCLLLLLHLKEQLHCLGFWSTVFDQQLTQQVHWPQFYQDLRPLHNAQCELNL